MSIESPILVHLPSFCSKVASLFKYPNMAIRLASSKYFSSSKPPSSLYPVPDMANDSPDGKTTFFNVCSFTVNVPVLSVATSERLDGIQFLDNNVLFGHSNRTDGKCQCQCKRKSFGHSRHRKCNDG